MLIYPRDDIVKEKGSELLHSRTWAQLGLTRGHRPRATTAGSEHKAQLIMKKSFNRMIKTLFENVGPAGLEPATP
ncbi:hypothetical protein SDC9_81432 [bioreactor metagenome]|uniref:Uncharacterized protein n=1 Tax=bioreactor metagenome TaxID=1076179 RepID=A0A644Z268_9ZZZZ